VSIPRPDVFAPDFLEEEDHILNTARERNPFAMSDRGVEVLGYPECRALLRDRRLQTDHMTLVKQVGLTDPAVLAS
jgi:hypothetical protein